MKYQIVNRYLSLPSGTAHLMMGDEDVCQPRTSNPYRTGSHLLGRLR